MCQSQMPYLTADRQLRYVSYYRIFMYLYSASLRRTVFLMANSSWTKNHVDGILQHRDVFLDFVHTMLTIAMPVSLLNVFGTNPPSPKTAKIVYPPCETQELVDFTLKGREDLILSVAQFRWVIVGNFLRYRQADPHKHT